MIVKQATRLSQYYVSCSMPGSSCQRVYLGNDSCSFGRWSYTRQFSYLLQTTSLPPMNVFFSVIFVKSEEGPKVLHIFLYMPVSNIWFDYIYFYIIGKIFKLMDGVYQTAGTNQAIYIMELLIQNMIHLGLPYSKSLLDNMPIRLVSFLILST